MSLLCLYHHIFDAPGYRRAALIIIIVLVLWFVGAMIGNFIICIPFDSFWLRLKPGRCLDFNAYALAIGVIEVLLDVTILALPIRVVMDLRVPTHKKIGLTDIFLLGGL